MMISFSLQEPRRPSTTPFGIVVILGRLLHRAMARLFHGFREWNATIGRFGEITGTEAVGREFLAIKPGQLRPLFDDPVDGAGFKRTRRNITAAIDFSKHAALVDFATSSQRVRASMGRPVR